MKENHRFIEIVFWCSLRAAVHRVRVYIPQGPIGIKV